ncbi:calcium-binding protein [Thalassovita sp.]|uniref:calcium-binding protein n=1 Tax=Thalassovita sp. TaxID=1979401 RepID=UPI002B26A1FE|nr:calcium-binding protein [Thalassovita sp.]
MPDYVTIPIYDRPDAPAGERIVIGAGIFDRDLGAGPYGQFLGLISDYHPNDYNFDGEVSLWERFTSTIVPGNYAETRFTYQAFTQLLVETADPIFQSLRTGVLVPYMQDLAEWGIDQAYGLPPDSVEDLVSALGNNLIGQIVDRSISGFIPQLFVTAGFEYVFDQIFLNNVFPDDSTNLNFEVRYIGDEVFSESGTENYYVVAVYENASITIGGGDDTVHGRIQLSDLNGGAGIDRLVLDYSGTLHDGRTVNSISFTRLDSSIQESATLSDGTVVSFRLNGFEAFDITATEGDDWLAGLPFVVGRPVPEGVYFRGLGGNDILDGGAGADTLEGGAGDDRLRFIGLGDVVRGGTGTDTLEFDLSDTTNPIFIDLISGIGAGSEWSGVEVVSGELGAGDDTFIGAAQLSDLSGGAGIDRLVLDYSGTLHDGRTVNSISFTRLDSSIQESATLSDGTVVSFRLNGFEAFDITATEGDDWLAGLPFVVGRPVPEGVYFRGLGGNDILDGGAGADTLEGGAGDDLISGNDGDDILIYDAGSDGLNGGIGNDIVQLHGTTYHTAGYVAYNVSSDTQVGTQARINLEGLVRIEAVTDGGADADIAQLSAEGDAFFLHDAYSGFHSSIALTEDYVGNESTARFANIEEIRGMGGDDIIDLTSPDYSLSGVSMIIDGGEGNDVIWGSDANEHISGGNGDDTIFGGIGTDVLSGNLGADVFEFTRTSTNTSVTDFDVGEGDMLRFYNTGGAEFDASSVALTATGIIISYTDTATGIEHDISIALAPSAADFTATLSEIQSALEII